MKFSPTVSIVVALALTYFSILSHACNDPEEKLQGTLLIRRIIVDPLPTPNKNAVAQFSLPGPNLIRCGVRGGIFTLEKPIDPSKIEVVMFSEHPYPPESDRFFDRTIDTPNGKIRAYMVESCGRVSVTRKIGGRLFHIPGTNVLGSVYGDVPFANEVTATMRITVKEVPFYILRSFGSRVTVPNPRLLTTYNTNSKN